MKHALFMGLVLALMPRLAWAAPPPPAPQGCCGPAWLPVPPNILLAQDRPWEELGGGYRRKVFNSNRVTMVLFEIRQAAGSSDEGKPVPTHHHNQDQVTYVLDGRARVQVGDIVREVGPGAVYIVPPDVPHGMRVLGDHFVGLDVFSPVRPDFSVGANEVKSFVYRWFSWFDHQVDEEVFVRHLASSGLHMQFPEGPLNNTADFRKWYRNVRTAIASNTHQVETLTVRRNAAGSFDVDMTVLWKGLGRDGSHPSLHVRQHWLVTAEPDGHLRIHRYEVKPISAGR